jgi:hypothetical protein
VDTLITGELLTVTEYMVLLLEIEVI